MDESGSIRDYFGEEKDLVKKIADEYQIKPGGIHIGVEL
jgi:hypothetical protein